MKYNLNFIQIILSYLVVSYHSFGNRKKKIDLSIQVLPKIQYSLHPSSIKFSPIDLRHLQNTKFINIPEFLDHHYQIRNSPNSTKQTLSTAAQLQQARPRIAPLFMQTKSQPNKNHLQKNTKTERKTKDKTWMQYFDALFNLNCNSLVSITNIINVSIKVQHKQQRLLCRNSI